MRCKITLLGAPRLLDEDEETVPVPGKAFILFAYLLLNGRKARVDRVSVRQLLWPAAEAATAAANLRQLLARIRERETDLGVELIHSRSGQLELNCHDLDIDLAHFLALLRQPEVDIAELCGTYTGSLLEQVESEEAEIRDWLDVERTKLRSAFIAAIAARIEPADAGADNISVRIAARRLLQVDPYNEVGHRALMRLFAEENEPGRAREIYAGLEARLRDDLGVAPELATKELYRSLLPKRAAAAAGQSAPPEAPSAPLFEGDASLQEFAAAARDTARASPASIYARAGCPKVTILPPAKVGKQDRYHLAVSLIEDVTIGLCRFKALSIIAPHTAWQLSVSGNPGLLRTLAIDYAIETQIQNRGGEHWLSVKLVNAASREILWTERYPFEQAQTAHHYRELSLQIIVALVDKIERAELTLYAGEQDATAYHLYLAGQRYLRTLDLPNVRRARRAFKAAVSHCPDFVPGISGQARTYHLEWLLMARGDGDLLAEAEQLANRSLEIDPDDARGYRELGICNAYTGRFDESLEALAEGEQRNPQFADLLNDFADALVHACEPAAALEKINHAIALNPLCPDQYFWAVAGASYQLGRYAEARDSLARMRDRTPALRLMAASCAMLGEKEQAREYVRKTREVHPDFSVKSWLSVMPFRDKAVIENYEQGLRLAGFD